MSIQKRALILLIATTIMTMAGVAALSWNEIRVSQRFFRQEIQDKQRLFDRVHAYTGRFMEMLAQDYALWDEMAEFARGGHDAAWADEEIGFITGTYKVKAVWVCDRQGRLRYHASRPPEDQGQHMPVPADRLATLFAQQRTCHYYLPTGSGLLEVYGSTIHPTADQRRETEPMGYFFVARVLDTDFLDELGRMAGARVALLQDPCSREGVKEINARMGRFCFARALPGWNGRPQAWIEVVYTTSIVRDLNHKFTHDLIFATIMIVLVAAILTLAMIRWVILPLRAISVALKSEDSTPIRPLLGQSDEMGFLARLITQSFDQKIELLGEIVERLRTEKELTQAEERFRIAAESASDLIYEWDLATGAMAWHGDIEGKLGYAPGEFPRTRAGWETSIHADDVPAARAAFDRHCLDNVPLYAEYRVHRKDGTCLYVTDRGRMLRDVEGARHTFIGGIADITQRKRMEDELRNLSLTDPLTGLYNRRGFMTMAGGHVSIAQRQRETLVLFYTDLDGLKAVNDTLGHAAGDDMIIQTSLIMKTCFRQSDIIARLGGDEFAVLCMVAHPENYGTIQARIQEAITAFNAAADHAYTLSMSIGVVRHAPDTPCSMEDLLKEADQAMYADKRSKKSWGNLS